MKSIKRQLLLTCFLFFLIIGNAQKIIPKDSHSNSNEEVLRYEEFLREETKLHREYTQHYYDMILQTILGLGTLFGVILTWVNWKSKKNIKDQVNSLYKKHIKSLLDEKLKEIDTLIKDGKEKSEKEFETIRRIILELSGKLKEFPNNDSIIGENNKQDDISELKGKEILWVDDFPINNEYPRSVLEEAGVKFTLALDTNGALEKLKTKSFDVIISDMGRGKNTTAGIELLKKLIEINFKKPVVIFSSPSSIDAFGEEALSYGAVAVTSSTTGLLNVIQRLI